MKVKDVQHGKTTRKSFARINEILEMPNLIEVQKKSYQWFLDEGLREVFADTASITDYTGNLELSFLDYSMDEAPKYSVEECKARDATYASPLKVRMRLRNKETGEIKEQEIFMGDFPKMTDSATFIINGAERVDCLPARPFARASTMAGSYDKTDKLLLYRNRYPIPRRVARVRDRCERRVLRPHRQEPQNPDHQLLSAPLGVKTDAEIQGTLRRGPAASSPRSTKDPRPYLGRGADGGLQENCVPGEPPTVESADQPDGRDCSSTCAAMIFPRVGRYKYNKKLDIARRITGHKLLEPVVDPMTGEVLAEAEEILTRDKARLLSRRGVNHAVIESSEGTAVKVFGNGMVDIGDFQEYTGFTAEELDVKEKVRFSVLKEIIDSGASGDELKKTVQTRIHDLIPKTIIVDDMLASICYLLNLGHGIGNDR